MAVFLGHVQDPSPFLVSSNTLTYGHGIFWYGVKKQINKRTKVETLTLTASSDLISTILVVTGKEVKMLACLLEFLKVGLVLKLNKRTLSLSLYCTALMQ